MGFQKLIAATKSGGDCIFNASKQSNYLIALSLKLKDTTKLTGFDPNILQKK